MQSLNGQWNLKSCNTNKSIKGNVPGSVYADLLSVKLMPDPYYGENEEKVRELSLYDYEYSRDFEVTQNLLQSDKVMIVFEGIDTIADIYVNDTFIFNAENFHLAYEYDIKAILKKGINSIKVVLHSPIKYIEGADNKRPLWGVTYQTMRGYNHIRKPHYMFGWDWGPKLPDLGIWNNIYLKGINDAVIKDIYVSQKHSDGKVKLHIECSCMVIRNENLFICINIVSPDGNTIYTIKKELAQLSSFDADINKPQLWWPAGMGKQPLYTVNAEITRDNNVISDKSIRTGLRTLTISRAPDKWGESFCFKINGKDIFAKGANYIPEDNIIGLCTKERTKKLLESCIMSNFNCVRVWGGGHYATDYFMDLCDEMGLIVWHDFMFACAVYELTDTFKHNIRKEIIYNIKRLRNHTCLGLWCGNNEMELAWYDWGLPDNKKLKQDYFEQFERMIPELVNMYSPDTFYWPASPSSEGGMVDPNSDSKGDAHYWEVWHGKKWFSDFRNHYFRFASEYGFQSFPSIKTIMTFAGKDDLNLLSPVMEQHQKCTDSFGNNGNMIISNYLGYYYLYPDSFEKLIYASQILQGDCLKEAIMHFRRNRGRCMGSTYWQLNDSNPVISWATIDYFGRWKAAQYYVRRCYAPVTASAIYDDGKLNIYVINDTVNEKKLRLEYRIINQDKGDLLCKGIDIISKPLSSDIYINENISDLTGDRYQNRNIYLEYRLLSDNEIIMSDTLLFVKPKEFDFRKPHIEYSFSKKGNETFIEISSDVFASKVGIEFDSFDLISDDNYFDLVPGIKKSIRLCTEQSTEVLMKEIKITSICDIAH